MLGRTSLLCLKCTKSSLVVEGRAITGTAMRFANQARPSSQKVWLHIYRTQWSLTALAVEIFLISPALRKENITI